MRPYVINNYNSAKEDIDDAEEIMASKCFMKKFLIKKQITLSKFISLLKVVDPTSDDNFINQQLKSNNKKSLSPPDYRLLVWLLQQQFKSTGVNVAFIIGKS